MSIGKKVVIDLPPENSVVQKRTNLLAFLDSFSIELGNLSETCW